ncbi:MAG: FAD-dependent oxidoreductase [Cohaesibacteraceae bacterium]|nr:FAD-dependent oxidoreductase [Cohaesibacteraceae bacterium]
MKRVMEIVTGRREFLIFVAAMAFMNRFGIRTAGAESKKPQALVIGAGLAGLSAAQVLSTKGFSVTILEARHRIGGRLFTDTSLGTPVELGASFIHGFEDNPLSRLVGRLNVRTFETDSEDVIVYDKKGNIVPEERLFELEDILEELRHDVDKAAENNESLQQAIKRVDAEFLNDPLNLWALTSTVEFDTGGPIEDLSAEYFDEDAVFEGGDILLPDGLDAILSNFINDIEFKTDVMVQDIKYNRDHGVEVSTSQGIFRADIAICTLPLGVLKNGDVSFDPPLPKKYRHAIDHIPMGNVTKLALQFDKPFWDVETEYFGALTDQKGRWPLFMNYRTISNENILLGLCFGSYSSRIEASSDNQIQADMMDVLRDMFGDSVAGPVNYVMSRWSVDPFSKGAYSFTGINTRPSHFQILAKPIDNVLMLAGEHTHFLYHGTLHGAYISGQSAALKLFEIWDSD